MNNKQAIIDKIINDANQKASVIVEEARVKASAIVETANAEASKLFEKNEGKSEILTGEILMRRALVAKLDDKKNLLAKKLDVVDEAFAKAIEEFVGDKDYLKIVEKMIENNCEDGDEVAIASSDKSKITAAFIEKIAKKCSKKITLKKGFAPIYGGVILVGKKCDKNLSLDLELASLREKIQAECVEILFEESK